MSRFHSQLIDAPTATDRMDALCRFIEFWLGPRQESYGESKESLAGRHIPTPLRRLYQFAGRWPNWDDSCPVASGIPAFSHQDVLLALNWLERLPDGRIIFSNENQGMWGCRTLSEGDDPPVWCRDDFVTVQERNGGDKLVCDSLSRFLTTFVLQEAILGSRLCLHDPRLGSFFELQSGSADAIWLNGPYVYDSEYSFFLWRGVLVARLWNAHFFGANSQMGIQFLIENQGQPTESVSLVLREDWTLNIRTDSSAQVVFAEGTSREIAEVPPDTFDVVYLLKTLAACDSGQGEHEHKVGVHYHRGSDGAMQTAYLHNEGFTNSLFRFAFLRAAPPNDAMRLRFEAI